MPSSSWNVYRLASTQKKLDLQTRNEALLDLLLINQYLLFDICVSDSFGCSDPNITELGISLNKLKILEKQT